ncbi:MAG: hypothetical protein RLY61_330 [Candidatus Parcubacteria bacterium]|jgi:hypothetical protein
MNRLIKGSLILTYILLSYSFINIYRADSYAKSAEGSLKELELTQAQNFATKAIQLNPNEPYYYRVLAKVYLTKSVSNTEYKDKTLSVLSASLKLNTHNLATIRNNTPIYYYLALNNIKNGTSSIDEKYLKHISNHMTKYKKVYPNDLGLIVLFAKYEKKLELRESYKESIERIKTLRPDILTWYPGL